MNQVEPSFIRVEADEATYNLHIMVRFELERVLMNGDLAAADLPHEWNRRYKEYLGVDVPNDAARLPPGHPLVRRIVRLLPDVHASATSTPRRSSRRSLEDVPTSTRRSRRATSRRSRRWLNENLHAHGSRYEASDLCVRATGKPLSADPLLRHLEGKLRPLYGV